MDKNNVLPSLINSFNAVTKKPEQFLSTNEETQTTLKDDLKSLYDFAKQEEIKKIRSDALPELISKNFEIEQIWQQIELQNDSLLTRSLLNVSKVVVNKNKLLFKEEGKDDGEDDNESEKESNSDEVAQSESDNLEEEELLSEGDNVDSDEAKDPTSTNNRPAGKKSVVDDEFFKLDEMENFLRVEERKMNEPDSGNDSEESDSEEDDKESVDLFKDDPEEDDENNKVRLAKYKDFFVQSDELSANKGVKRNKFLEGVEDSDEPDEDDVDLTNQNELYQSTFEKRQERLQRKIKEMEEIAVDDKPWQLKGEIKAENRPQNSLLQEIVEFDMTTRPAPVQTEQTTLQLEDIIKQRIKDKVFDSVVRKVKPVDTPLEYKKKLVLDQEKSKQSLAQIYEQDFLQKQAELDPEFQEKEEEEPTLHKEIKTMMRTLFNQLDALSNFHFTPKAAVPELKIVSNLPAISMEEVAPVATSDAALLAPEEVLSKAKGEIIGKGERTNTDKKRERRKKKSKQSFHAKEKEKRELLTDKQKQGKQTKEKSKQMLEKMAKETNIDKMDESTGSKNVKSSTAFFTQLQEEVQNQIKSKTKAKKTSNKNVVIAKKIKL